MLPGGPREGSPPCRPHIGSVQALAENTEGAGESRSPLISAVEPVLCRRMCQGGMVPTSGILVCATKTEPSVATEPQSSCSTSPFSCPQPALGDPWPDCSAAHGPRGTPAPDWPSEEPFLLSGACWSCVQGLEGEQLHHHLSGQASGSLSAPGSWRIRTGPPWRPGNT